MKKFISALLAGIMLTTSCVSVYADDAKTTVNIATAKYDKTSDKVTVTGKIENSSESQSITVMSTGIKDNTYDTDQIIYIDQNDNVSVDENGNFSLSFALSDSAVKEARYYVRIGGNNIDNPAYMAFLFSDDAATILYGDVDNDGSITAKDAKLLLEYVLDPSKANITEAGFKNAQIYEEKIDKFTAKEVAALLQKALDVTYKFPVEQ